MAKFTDRKLVGVVDMSKTTEIQVSTVMKDDEPSVDIRTFLLDVDNAEDLTEFAKNPSKYARATKKGVFLSQGKFVELMKNHLIPHYTAITKKGGK